MLAVESQDLKFSLVDLSSYVPKHSLDFSAWQEHKRDESVYQEDSASQQAQMTEEVMVSEATSTYQDWKV